MHWVQIATKIYLLTYYVRPLCPRVPVPYHSKIIKILFLQTLWLRQQRKKANSTKWINDNSVWTI